MLRFLFRYYTFFTVECRRSVNFRHAAMEQEPLHVVMFPWLAHGHISSYAELSIRLSHQGIKVSFFSTPLNIASIKPFFASYEKSKIQLVELPLPNVEGLPPEIENASDLPMHLSPLFTTAVDGLEAPFEKLLAEICPDCVVFDFVQWWAGRAAAKLGISCINFTSFGAAFSSYATHPVWRGFVNGVTAEDLMVPPENYPSRVVTWRLFEAERALLSHRAKKPGTVSYTERSLRGLEACDVVAVKACEELEGKFLQYMREVTGKPVLPLGPLLPCRSERRADSDCMTWLDTQAPGSVAYVSFGSQCFLSKEEIAEVALGLEASWQPFLLALHNASLILPEGFIERVGNRGFVAVEWVPQREILAHPSTGVFLTHCGWNSVMEGLSNGLPLIPSPVQYDQGLNTRLVVEELKAGVEVGRRKDGAFDREEICNAVRMVMGEEGRGVRAKAREIGEMFQGKILLQGGSQGNYIHQFVEHLYLLKAKAKTKLKKGVVV